ncbi:MAG: amidohydrolase family protein [Actinomycetota bacterium]|nr:amidohydrolase family protein [Actinomycetota bacterium]
MRQLSTEPILDPDLAICDPHHHYWHHPTNPYLLEQLHADTEAVDEDGRSHNVESTVFVECMAEYLTDGPPALRPVGETRFVTEAAERSATSSGAVIAGIVSFADLALGAAVEDVLDAHVEAGRGRFRGIRHATSWSDDPKIHNAHTNPPEGLMADREFRTGFDVLGRMGLSFDAWLYHTQLADLVDLARAHPDTTVILDHLGGPLGIGPFKGQRSAVLDACRGPLTALASCPQVFVKLGGIGMSIYGDGWHKMDTRPSSEDVAARWGDHIRFIIDLFGPDRCMFESNFPVDKTGIDYPVLWNAFKRIADGYDQTERAALFAGAARAAYRI